MMAAGFGAPASSSSSRRNSAVGALPMATTAPSSRSPHRSSAAAERVVPSFSASAGTRGSRSVQITSLLGRQARTGDAVGDHLGVAQDRRAGAQRGARRGDETVAEHDERAASTRPQAWIIRTATSASSSEKRDEIGLGADDGEGAP